MYKALAVSLDLLLNQIYLLFFYIYYLFTFRKILKDSPAQYYQLTKRNYKNKSLKRYQGLSRKDRKQENDKMVLNNTQIFWMMKNKAI